MRNLTVRFEGLDTTLPRILNQAAFFIDILSRKYRVTVLTEGNEEPDVLIYSWMGMQHLHWRRCIRIYYTMEMDFPDFNMCDYAIGLADAGMPDRFIHFPLYVFYNYLLKKYETSKPLLTDREALTRDFCSIVLKNNAFRDPICFDLFYRLDAYKPVASGGPWNNTVGGPVPDKLDFIKNYKFNLAIENTCVDGYVTEKIMEAFVAGTVPVYWGSSQVKKEFGEGGYIDISDFETLDRAVDYIKKVDSDDALYLDILRRGPQIPCSYDEWCDRLLDFLVRAIEHGKRLSNEGIYQIIHKEHFLVYHLQKSLPGRLYRKYLNTYYALQAWRRRRKYKK